MATGYGLDAESIRVLRRLVADELRRNQNPRPAGPRKRQRTPGAQVRCGSIVSALGPSGTSTMQFKTPSTSGGLGEAYGEPQPIVDIGMIPTDFEVEANAPGVVVLVEGVWVVLNALLTCPE